MGKMRKFRARENGGRAGKSFFPFFFLVCTFSIQRARLSQSLEKAEENLLQTDIILLGNLSGGISKYWQFSQGTLDLDLILPSSFLQT